MIERKRCDERLAFKGGENIIALDFTTIIRLPLLILHLIHYQTP
jgi:hypothetical protein